MNTYLFASVENMWLLAGWTMVHFLWLGTLVGLAALMGRWLLCRASANIRYAVAVSCLALLTVLPTAIASWFAISSQYLQARAGERAESVATALPLAAPNTAAAPLPNDVIELHRPNVDRAASVLPAAPTPAVVAPAAIEGSAAASRLLGEGSFVAVVDKCIPYLPWFWIIGTPFTFAVTATGLIGTRRLRSASRTINEGPIADTLARLVSSLGVTQRVAVAVCDRIAAPVLIGILRPLILLPPAALSGYSADEIEMVLLHELAHVRRWDNLVNLIQRLIESLLFFHPAVWLISSWVRREREACCDSLVVARTDHPHAYAELLVALAAQMPRSVLFHPAASSAMAAGPLRARIRHILKVDDDPMLISGRSFALMLAAFLTTITLAVLYLPSIGQAEQPSTKAKEAAAPDTAEKGAVASKPERLGSRDKQRKELRELQSEIKRKYEDYLDIARGMGRVAAGPVDSETELLLHDIADTQKKVADLTLGIYQLQADYMLAKSELSDPALLEIQAEEALKRDSQYVKLLQELSDARAATNDDSESVAESANHKIVQYRADFTKKAVREMQSKPNIPLQQLTLRFKTNADSMQKQLVLVTRSLEQKKKELEKRVGKSVEFETRGEELKHLQQAANELGGFDIRVEAEPLVFELKADGSGKTTILLNGKVTTEDSIRQLVHERVASNIDEAVSLSADKSIHYAEVMRVVDLLETLGIKKLALDTRSQAAKGTVVAPEADTAPKQHAPSSAIEPQVIATLSSNAADWENAGSEAVKGFLREFAEIQKQNHRADIIERDGKSLLVAIPQPKEADWPAMLGDSPRKERVIAEKAWQQLGLKLAPLNRAEMTYQRYTTGQPSGLLIVGGNVPKGLPLPSELVKLNTDSIENLDSLLEWLNKSDGMLSVKCYATADGHEYLFGSQPGTNSSPEALAAAHRDLAQTKPTPHRFPSLEDQKLADLAWKRLQLEIEPIRPDELKRVKGLGYDGGVVVADVAKHSSATPAVNEIQPGDILVGLHVWPIKSLQDVATVLNRNDIAELNPLKFYAVRLGDGPDDEAEISGRIPVNDLQPATYPSAPKSTPILNSNNAPIANSTALATDWREFQTSPSSSPPTRNPYEPSTASAPYIPNVVFENQRLRTEAPSAPHATSLPALAPAMPAPVTLTAPSITTDLQPKRLDASGPGAASPDGHSLLVRGPSPSSSPTDNEIKKQSNRVIYSDVDGVVRQVKIEGGEAVKKGTLLLELDSFELNKAMEAANIDLNTIQADIDSRKLRLDRNEKLSDVEKAKLESEIKMFRGRAEIFRKELDSLKVKKEDLKIKSPIDGRVATRNVQERLGSSRPVKRGEALLEIAATSPIRTADSDAYAVKNDTSLASKTKEAHRQSENNDTKYTVVKSEPVTEVLRADTIVIHSPEQVKIGALTHDGSGKATVELKTVPKAVPPTPAREPKASKSDDDGVTIVAHEIPKELAEDVNRYTGRLRDRVRTSWDDRGRLIMQAPRSRHEDLEKLLKFTSQWQESAAAKDPDTGSFNIRKVDSDYVLEWPATGLTFVRGTPTNAMPRGIGGACVESVVPGSPAAWFDVRPGDTVAQVAEFQVGSVADLASILKTLREGYRTERRPVVTFYRDTPGQGAGWVRADFPLRPEVVDPDAESSKSQYRRAARTDRARQELKTDKSPVPSTKAKGSVESGNGRTDSASANKSKLNYDGKSFDEWCTAWRTELSTAKRIEAAKAMAAFGAHGYGVEAAKQVLDIVHESGFKQNLIGGSPEANLRDELRSSLDDQIPIGDWFPLLYARYAADPNAWQDFALEALRLCSTTDEKQRDDIQRFLLEIANRPDSQASRGAIYTLAARYPANEELKRILLVKLKGDSPFEALNLYTSVGQFPPELLEILLHGDPKQQAAFRGFVGKLGGTAPTALAAALVDVIKNDKKGEDRVAAIRAIGAMRRLSEDTTDKARDALSPLVDHGPRNQQVAAAVALPNVVGSGDGDALMRLRGRVVDTTGKPLGVEEIQLLIKAEKKAMSGGQR